jgi:hypothetical protein
MHKSHLTQVKPKGIMKPYFFAVTLAVTWALSACTSTQINNKEVISPQAQVSFIDISKFDRELASSVDSPLESVDVVFYDRVGPNNMPERLQKWLSAVEKNGGVVRVVPPPNELAPRDPLALISLMGNLFNVIKNMTAINTDKVFETVKGRDAAIALERNATGELVVAKLQFTKRTP